MTANELYVKGARIWISDPEAIWRGAELLEDYKGPGEIKVRYEDGEDSVLAIKDKNNLPHLRNPEILIGENDLTSLSYLNEPEVLYNLQVRFMDQNIIYTYCGIVLVAINPYADLPIYGNEIIQAYSGQDMGAMDPHIFAVAEEAYKKMSRFEQNQSIIVSGESGAGKTVSAKYAMRYFAMVGGSQAETQVEKRVLASNPIMEAIGNAKTTRNDNSSRFGKYIELSFNKKNEIIGAHMRTYLLEKSRVVYQASDERNYHIFYQMCASSDLPEFKKFQLMAAGDFFYTAHGGDPVINGVDDAEDLGDTRDALLLLGISAKDQMMIFQILAAILHFGNVRIKEAEGETSEISAKDKHLQLMCQLLGIEESQMRMWLCNKKFTTVGEVLTKPLTAEQASNAQDALAKHIYAKMFDWIVEKVNLSLHSTTKHHRFIGVLDIYGFETFEINSFEQFCINYANEKLQQIFNSHVFKLEQEEYVKEAIEWSFIDFYDNQPCIDLIESKLGILDLLDEECRMPKGSDKNWCQKLYDKHYNKAQHFDKPRMSNMAFIIHHFADKVTYQADGFLEKNRDTVLEDHINILRASEHALVAELFEDKPDPNEKKQRAGSHPTQPLRANPKGSKSTKKTVGSQQVTKATVGDQFRDSLFMLMTTLNATTPHYIRCIKPNDLKEAFQFDPKRGVEQLRACGVLETIRISAAGYPSRWTYSEFFQRYRVLARSKDIDRANPRKTCQNILISIIQESSPTKHRKNKQPIEDPDKYRFGKTKIFFRAGQVAYLEKLRSDKLRSCGIMIQKHVKGWLERKRYRKITKSITLLQKYGRGLLARRYARHLRETWAAKTIQKRWKGYKARSHYEHVRNAVLILQASIRGFFGRREFEKALHTHRAVVIQRYARGWLARVRYRRVIRGIIKLQGHYRRRKAKKELQKLKIEAKSVDHIKNVNKGLENKIIQLQQQLDVRKQEMNAVKQQEGEMDKMKVELEKLRGSSGQVEKSSNKITELLAEIKALKIELEKEQIEKQDLIAEKEIMRKDKVEIANKLTEENNKLSADLELAKTQLDEQEKELADMVKAKVEAAKKQLLSELDSEREHHQKLVKEHARLQQRLENLHGEMEYLTSPQGHKRTPSDISAISLESYTSSVSPDEKKEEEENEKEDQGYGTEKSKKKKKAPAPPLPVNGETKDIDVGLLLKLQNRVKDLEKEKAEMQKEIDTSEEQEQKPTSSSDVITDSAFNALKKQLVNADDVQLVIKLQKRVKDLELTKSRLRSELDDRDDDDDELTKFQITTPEFAYNNLKMQELENENDKLKREVGKLMKAITDSTDFTQQEVSPSGKELMDQFEAMNDELERRREECLQLRAMMAEKSITTHAIAKESYGGNDNIVNEDNELAMAYRTQKELNRKYLTKRIERKKRETWKMLSTTSYPVPDNEIKGGTEVEQPGQSSTMGAAASTGDNQSDDEDDKSLTSNYSTRNSTLWNNNKSVSLIDNPNAVSVQYLDLMNETSGYWTFDDSVKTRVSHVLLDQNEEEEFESHDLTAKVLKLKDIVSHDETESKSELNDSNVVESCDSGLNESHVTSETCESSYSDLTSNPGDQIMSDQDVKCNSVDESVSSTDEDKKEQITGDQDEKCDINIKSDCYPVEAGMDQITSNQDVTCDISIKSDCSPVEDGKNQIMSEEDLKCNVSIESSEFSQTVDNADSDSLITTKLEPESELKGVDNMAANISEIARPVDVCNAQIEQPKSDIDVENENDRIMNTDKSDSNLQIMKHGNFHEVDAKISSDFSQGDDVSNVMSRYLAISNVTFSENIDTSENDSLLAEKEPQFQGIDNLAVDVMDDGSDTSSDIDNQDKLKIIGQEFENVKLHSLDNNTLKDEENDHTNDHCILNSESTSVDTHENNKGDVEITCDTNSQSELYMSDENLSGDEVYMCQEHLDNSPGISNENGSNASTSEITAFEKRENVKSIDDSETWDIDNSFDDDENTDDHIDDEVKVCLSDENSEKEQVVINNDESKIGALENNISTGGRVFNKNLYTINEIEVVENNNEKMFSELCQGDVNEMEYSAEKSNNKFEQKLWDSIEQNMTEICEPDSHESGELKAHHDHVSYEQNEEDEHVLIECSPLDDVCQCGNEQKTSNKHHVCHKNCEVVQALFTNNSNHDISDCLNHLSDKDNQTSNLGNYKLETINESCHESINPSNQFHDHSEKTCDFTKNFDSSHIDCDKTDNNDSVFEKENDGKVMYEQTNHDWHQVNHDHQLDNNHKNDSNHDSEIAPDLIDKPVTNLSSRLHVDSEELFFEEENISDELCHSEISDNLKVLSDSKCNMCNLPDGQSCDKCVHHTKSHDDHSDCVHENNCHCHHHQQLSSKNKSHQHSAEELYDKHLSDVDFHNRKHFPDLNHSADDMSVEDGAYLTCSDNEQDEHSTCSEHEHGEHCSSMRYSQPESGFGETMSSDFNLTDKVFSHDSHLESQFEDLLEVENIEVPSPEESFEDCQYTNCHHDNTIDWDEGSICGCPDCLGRLRIERIITANKSTMCPDEAPYVLMCEICEELLENQLQKTEKDSKKKEVTLKKQVKDLKEENEKQQKIIQQNLQLGPEAKIEATMQHEITRLTSENLDLRESNDKNQDQIRKLKKMLKTYAKRLKDGEAAEIAAEIDKDDTKSNEDNVAHVKHRERNYMGMLEYRKEDEQALIKNLIMDLKPRVAVGLLPGLPAYVLFMCVRHTDYVNDDEKVRGLLTNTINGIKKCVKKHHSDVERVTLWLTNTCRLLHTLKQYSGEKAFQADNSPRQNEHGLRNFDLSEYRQVFSDLAVWIYQTMIKQMQESVQQMIVPAVLEHEAIAGLTASKPSGMRGRSSSNANELEEKELSLDSLMKVMNKYSQILAQHAVDPELVKQIFRQLYYFVASGALNNLLLRKDMCNWSKGMQIRYNLSHLEQWLRDNKLGESGALSALEPITQASQLLQARKTDADVDSICEMCSKLTTPQIVKILNLYTPVDEFEERVPVSFIRKIQKKLQGRQEADNTLLMDTKYTFPVTFPFNPSSIAMETIDVPEQLHLGFLNRH